MPTSDNYIFANLSDDNSDEMWDLLSVYADGEATSEEAAIVEDLLKSDAAYARQFTLVKTAGAAVQSYIELDPPASLRSAILASTSQRVTWNMRVMQAIDTVRASITPRFTLSLAGLAAAGLLVFVAFRGSIIRPNGSGPMVTTNSARPAPAFHNIPGPVPEGRDPISKPVVDAGQLAAAHESPAPPAVRREAPASILNSGHTEVASNDTGRTRHSVGGPVHDDSSIPVMPAAYNPDTDAQLQHAGRVTLAEDKTTDIAGDDVHISDVDAVADVKPANPAPDSSSVQQQQPAAAPTHIIVAKLTALPPDPNQVLTKADMARNNAALNSGYDRSTVRSMERKQASISILHGTF